MKKKLHVLNLEDNPYDTELLKRSLSVDGIECSITRVETAEDFLAALNRNEMDIIIADYKLPWFDGISALGIAKEKRPETPFIFFTGVMREERAIETLKMGADDYVLKEHPARLDTVVRQVLERKQEQAGRRQSEEKLHKAVREAEQRNREVTALLKAARAVIEIGEFEVIAKKIFDISKELLGAPAGYIALLSRDGSSNEVLFLDPGGLPCTVDPSLPMPNRGLRETVYRTGVAAFDNDFSNSEWMRFMPEGHVRLENVLFAPLILNKKTVGLMGLANKPGGFTDYDAQMASAFGEFLAISLHNSKTMKYLERAHADIKARNTELEKAYSELKEAEAKIIQQEKMASIGQLAAGIAHEINNPIGFVSSNLETLKTYTERLKQFVEAQTRIIASVAGEEEKEEIAAERKKLRLDAITADITKLIEESCDGAGRVQKIVQDLRNFSRIDESEYKMADINTAIESTINIVWNELKYKAEVKKELGKIPIIKCNIGKLSQVFMNILVNAAQAIEKHGEIKITTSSDSENIYISISDTGSGIPESSLGRIFEPFYTTKEVGKGTGLGLSVARDIIKQHKGNIKAESEPGRGTTFTIELPVAV